MQACSTYIFEKTDDDHDCDLRLTHKPVYGAKMHFTIKVTIGPDTNDICLELKESPPAQ